MTSESLPDGVTVVTKYQAQDGSLWDFPDTAAQRNAEVSAYTKANELLNSGASVLDCLRAIRPCAEDAFAPLAEINKDTKLTISYLQCVDYPRYCVTRFDRAHGIYVWAGQGNKGLFTFPNPYGAHISVQALIGYAKVAISESIQK